MFCHILGKYQIVMMPFICAFTDLLRNNHTIIIPGQDLSSNLFRLYKESPWTSLFLRP